MHTRFPFRGALAALLLAGGVWAAFAMGRRLEQGARAAWLTQAAQETERITDTCLFWLTTYQAQLRGAAALFHSSDEVNEDELFDALDVIEGLEAAVPLETVAFAAPGPDGWVVTLSTDYQGVLATGARLKIPEMTRALDSALELPDRVSMGVPFTDGERLLSPLTFAAPNAGVDGVVVTVVDLTALLQGLETLQVPEGLHLSLTAASASAKAGVPATIWGQPRPPSAAHEFSYATDSGQVHWEFVWDVLPVYRGGPDTQLARVVEVASLAIVALAGLVIGLLLRQNRRVRQQVEERTAELRVSVREAQQANRSKSVFLANMSHEIRTPLNAILGFSEILEGRLADAGQKQQLSGIREGAQRLLGLVNGILDLSRIDAGSLELEPQPTDARGLFDGLAADFGAQARHKGLAFVIEIDPELPAALMLDGRRLQQVLAYLLDNACKFTSQGTISLIVDVEPADDSHVVLVMSVRDTGVGIPEAESRRIFDAFTQRDGQSINDYGGLGLGLALTQRLVELMGGHVDMRSREGEGSQFTVHLPKVPVATRGPVAASGPDARVEVTGQPPAAPRAGGAVVADTSAEEPIPDSVRRRLPELAGELHAVHGEWERVIGTQTIDEVEGFAREMVELGTRFNYPPLSEWGTRLGQQAVSFDVTTMGETLQTFPQVCNRVEALASEAA